MSATTPTRDELKRFLRSLQADERLARTEGTYFSNLEDIWDPHEIATTDIGAHATAWFQAIVRTPEQGQALYAEAVDQKNLVHPMAYTDASSATNTRQRGTCFDFFRNNTAEKAHLLSDAPLCHKAFGFCAEAATGKINTSAETRLKLLNGVKPLGAAQKTRHTGLKHHKYNKFYFFLQKQYYDAKPPSILLIPLLDLDRVLNWNGTDEYDVMAITCGEAAEECQERTLKYTERVLLGASEADRVKLDDARKLLETFVKALASSNYMHAVEESFGASEGKNYRPYLQWKLLLSDIRDGTTRVCYPHASSDANWSTVKVAVGRAGLHSSLPDPYNMAVKAAINYSSFCGTALLPACPPESVTSSDGEMNTAQGSEEDVSTSRAFTAVATSFQNPQRKFVEMFSSD